MLGESAGMHLMAKLAAHIGDQELIERAAGLGVELARARPYYLRAAPEGEFIFGYSV